MAGEERRVAVESYHLVLDRVERRIFRIDRWRLPAPHGVPVRAVVYGAFALAAVLVASRLPALGALLGALPPAIPWVAVPALSGWLLSRWRVDGRPPHRALLAVARHAAAPKARAGLRPTRRRGARLSPVGEVAIAAVDDGRYRRGVVRGPALLTFCYPARLEARRGPLGLRRSPPRRAGRLRVAAGGRRPLRRAKVVRVPAGGEVRFR
jgi:hypothetical protein